MEGKNYFSSSCLLILKVNKKNYKKRTNKRLTLKFPRYFYSTNSHQFVLANILWFAKQLPHIPSVLNRQNVKDANDVTFLNSLKIGCKVLGFSIIIIKHLNTRLNVKMKKKSNQ